MKKIQSLKGMPDILPERTPVWQYVEGVVSDVFARYGFQEIRLPIMEYTELFKRSIGEVTDIVEKEMYSFQDRHGDSVSLRPEGTASCVRACEQNGLLYNQVQKLWYTGPMFRYERPQKGRQRQFHQFGVEAFGMVGPDIDAEILMLTHRLWRAFGCEDAVTLQLNNLGTSVSRARYKAALVQYLEAHKAALDEDSQQRLGRNPLRILDSKIESTQALLNDAPNLFDYLDEGSLAHFERLQALLRSAEVPYEVNPRLVRGLDYYSDTVFEWVTDKLGAQGTVCGGGRYDGLVEQLGGRSTPAIGFGMGIERLVLLLDTLERIPEYVSKGVDIYIAYDPIAITAAYQLGEQLRDRFGKIRCAVHAGGGSLKSQMKRADKSGAQYALILGETELKNRSVSLKPMQGQGGQTTLAYDALWAKLTSYLH